MTKDKNNGSVFLTNFCKIVGLLFVAGICLGGVLVSQVKLQEKTKFSIERLDTSVKTQVKEATTAIKFEQEEFKKENERQHKDIRDYVKIRTSDRWKKKNDKLYMDQLIRINNLKPVPHERVID